VKSHLGHASDHQSEALMAFRLCAYNCDLRQRYE